MSPRRISGPTSEPFTLAQARAFLRLDLPGFPGDTSQDTLISSWITAARQMIELATDTTIGAQTLEIVLDSFAPDPYWIGSSAMRPLIELPRGPVRSITSIEYVAADQADPTVYATVPVGTYFLTVNWPQRVALRAGAAWPSVSAQGESVRIRYLAGFAVGADTAGQMVGDDLIAAMRLLLGHFWLNRAATTTATSAAQAELPLGVQSIIWPNRASIGL